MLGQATGVVIYSRNIYFILLGKRMPSPVALCSGRDQRGMQPRHAAAPNSGRHPVRAKTRFRIPLTRGWIMGALTVGAAVGLLFAIFTSGTFRSWAGSGIPYITSAVSPCDAMASEATCVILLAALSAVTVWPTGRQSPATFMNEDVLDGYFLLAPLLIFASTYPADKPKFKARQSSLLSGARSTRPATSRTIHVLIGLCQKGS